MSSLKGILFGVSAGLLVTACTSSQVATATATVDAVLTDIQNVCSAVVDDSKGAVATLIGSFPLGTTALAIADSVCTYIDSVPAIPTAPAASAKLMSRAKAGAPLGVALNTVVVNGVALNFAKTK